MADIETITPIAHINLSPREARYMAIREREIPERTNRYHKPLGIRYLAITPSSRAKNKLGFV